MADKEYKRKGYAPDLSDCDNISAVTQILLDTVKAGRPPAYQETEHGLEEFRQKTLEYINHVQAINSGDDDSKKVIVDIESWACYLGITRATIATYERTRDSDWKQFIAVVKNGIAAVKKEAAFHGQMQPMIAVFDMANNHDYKNTNEFKLNVSPSEDDRKVLSAKELPKLGDVESVEVENSI